MTTPNRAIIIILDGVGIGEMPDAAKFNDQGSHTLGNLAKAVGGLKLSNLEKLGLGNIEPIDGLESQGSTSSDGHWTHSLNPYSTLPTAAR